MNGLCDEIRNEVYVVRLYVYRLTRLDGTGAQSLVAVNETLEIATQAFADIGILFSVQEFEELKVEDDAYEFDGHSEIDLLLAHKSHDDGIDIFFCGPGIYDQAISFVGGVAISETANVIGGGTAPFCDQPDIVPSAVLAHEIGHSLGLIHPDNQLEFNNPPDNNMGLCDDSGLDCRCHDHVFDTEAFDNITQVGCMFDNCDCNPTSCGPFQNVVKNIMTTSTPLHCKTEFTQGQANRMKRYLAKCDILQNIVSNIIIPKDLDIVWDTPPRYCLPSVEIADGASLTVKPGVDDDGFTVETVIEFAPESTITVLEGGRLKIEGGAILRGCENNDWKGMRINGNAGTQLPPFDQGWVTIDGGSVIEKAENVRVSLGGVLRCDDADFINCGVVGFSDYPKNNLSSFNNCDFIRNPAFSQGPSSQLVFSGTKNVPVVGCTFDNTGSGSATSDAIVGFDSKFSIRDCSIKGYYFGIAGYDWGGNPFTTFSAKGNTFTDNFIGVVSYGVNNIVVRGNDFTGIGNNGTGGTDRGLELNNCSGYMVDGGNTFTGAGPGSPSIGILAYNTGSENHTISNNSFKSLNVANQAELGNNNPIIPLDGLQYSCITNIDAINFDFFITDGGIASNQGNSAATQNTFSHFNTGQPGDFNNVSATEIDYFHGASFAETPQANMFFGITLNQTNNPTECGGGGGSGDIGSETGEPDGGGDDSGFTGCGKDTKLTVLEEQGLVAEYSTTKSEYDSLKLIHATLRSTSQAAADTKLEMAKCKKKIHQVTDCIIKSTLADTSDLDIIKLRTWLVKKESREADYKVVETYFYGGDFASAVQLKDSIPLKYSLSLEEVREHELYEQWIDFKMPYLIRGESSKLLSLQEDDLDVVMEIAYKSNGIAGTQARSLLNGAYGYRFVLSPKMPNGNGRQALLSPPSGLQVQQATQSRQVSAFPNPAKERVNFSYQLEEDAGFSYILLTDINGKQVGQLVLQGQEGQVKWDTSHLPGGIYLYRLVSEYERGKTYKLVLTNW